MPGGYCPVFQTSLADSVLPGITVNWSSESPFASRGSPEPTTVCMLSSTCRARTPLAGSAALLPIVTLTVTSAWPVALAGVTLTRSSVRVADACGWSVKSCVMSVGWKTCSVTSCEAKPAALARR